MAWTSLLFFCSGFCLCIISKIKMNFGTITPCKGCIDLNRHCKSCEYTKCTRVYQLWYISTFFVLRFHLNISEVCATCPQFFWNLITLSSWCPIFLVPPICNKTRLWCWTISPTFHHVSTTNKCTTQRKMTMISKGSSKPIQSPLFILLPFRQSWPTHL